MPMHACVFFDNSTIDGTDAGQTVQEMGDMIGLLTCQTVDLLGVHKIAVIDPIIVALAHRVMDLLGLIC
ncbi:hypothetical protein ACP70R_033668 [Stipagrostis hirtigluma subsp. patula]